ncbi:HhH-GPD superfamily base excision DNA repair protein family protein [Cryptosporidium meleagridis]|uniref:DNA-(apurinic or apyrimidinic site) lyase n=1 Tax=Cryptosporidium meleagridis TaxID=93969 RepID=A0A2P4YYH8_9CRYT|nr:HhH-GPD superfamily base excision DNA repair protein family protein [Cryptosporidium meleagridis]
MVFNSFFTNLANKNLPEDTWRFHVLVAAFLSSQTKDEVTAACMNRLIDNGLSPEFINNQSVESLRDMLYGVGFYNTKAKNLKEISRIIIQNYSGKVPEKYEQLVMLPGIGPKMANLILQIGFGIVVGISVDTHMHRIFNRIGWVKTKNPIETSKEMEKMLPRIYWNDINKVFVGYGQTICKPINPKCQECNIRDYCSHGMKWKKKVSTKELKYDQDE